MTIDEQIKALEYLKKCGIFPFSDTRTGIVITDEYVDGAINTMHKYQQLEDFAKWVATEVIDEELWTYNHLSFAELTCRKLVKLGIMQESDGEYTYEVVEDGNND